VSVHCNSWWWHHLPKYILSQSSALFVILKLVNPKPSFLPWFLLFIYYPSMFIWINSSSLLTLFLNFFISFRIYTFTINLLLSWISIHMISA
jgi:hypothetical protein